MKQIEGISYKYYRTEEGKQVLHQAEMVHFGDITNIDKTLITITFPTDKRKIELTLIDTKEFKDFKMKKEILNTIHKYGVIKVKKYLDKQPDIKPESPDKNSSLENEKLDKLVEKPEKGSESL